MFATALVLSAALGPAADPLGGKDAYHRIVAAALARSQKSLAASIDLEIDHSRWEDPWVVTSAHFEVRSTHSFGQASELSKNLEYLRGEWVELLGEGRSSTEPARIWVFPTIADYNRFGNEHGAEHSSMLGSFFAASHPDQPVVTYQNGNWTLLGMWITHSAVHQHLSREFERAPEVWVDEGLASWSALAWDWKYGASQLAELAASRRLVPLERLLSDPLPAYVGRSHERFIQLGMLFRYLLEVCEATKDERASDPPHGPFRDFLRASVRGQRAEQGELTEVLATDAELIDEDFRAFDFSTW
jgi:hypothetical protein